MENSKKTKSNMENLKKTKVRKEVIKMLNKFITRENGFLAINRNDGDCIELTKEEALSLAAFIEKNKNEILSEVDM